MRTDFKLLNIIYTNNMEESVAFYETLGLQREVDGDIDQWWNAFTLGSGSLALHWNNHQELPPTGGNPDLNLSVPATGFDAIYANVASLNPSEINTLQGMGRYFVLIDPNGVRVQINEEL